MESIENLPSTFSVENYRAFGMNQEIELRPLTLFFGWNSGGKSALLRFLPLVADTIRARGPALHLSGEVARGATWTDMVCRARQDHRMHFSLRWSDGIQGAFSARWTILGDPGGRFLYVMSLTIEHNGHTYEWGDSNGKWRGLLPDLNETGGPDEEEKRHAHRSLFERLGAVESHVQWLTGVRLRPPRQFAFGGGLLPQLRSDGSNAMDFLIASKISQWAPTLLTETAHFFSELDEDLDVDEPYEGVFRLTLAPRNARHVRVNLADTGEGYAQVLPVLIGVARAVTDGPRILCLEQPELHLYTRAQAILAKLLTAAASTGRPRILVETHSEVLLSSVQLAVARGELDKDRVRVYWIESRSDGTSEALPVDFDDLGYPTSPHLTGAFSEVVSLGRHLSKVRRGRLE